MDSRLPTKLIYDPQSLNYYAYSRNNPIVYVDPSGEFGFLAALLTAAFVAITSGIQYANAPDVSMETKTKSDARVYAEVTTAVVVSTVSINTVKTAGTLLEAGQNVADDVGISDPAEYANEAQDFFTRGMDDTSGYYRKIDDNGVVRIYDPDTNTFGAFSSDGSTRTYYKPDPSEHHMETNMDYWDAQSGYEF